MSTDIFQFDHIVIAVEDLDSAITDYQALGFTVTPGGEHPAFGSRNALIPFEDGSYLELISFPEKREFDDSPAARRVQAWRGRRGIVDFALLPGDIHEETARARARGIEMAGPQAGSRRRPDGQEVAWFYSFPDGQDLPFLCADVSPRELRVPTGPARQHANGALGILRLSLLSSEMERTLGRYRALLDQEGDVPSPSSPEDRGVVAFRIGAAMLALVPAGEEVAESATREAGNSTGALPYRLDLRTRRPDITRTLDKELTHGAPLSLESEGA